MSDGARGYSFGAESERILAPLLPELVLLARRVISVSPVDFALVEGLRTPERQRMLHSEGKSRTLHSKHCEGRALDLVPWLGGSPDYGAVEDCCFLVGLFYGIAKTMDMPLRVGALWDGNSIKHNKFLDVWHVEIP
jgi:peptidoglycan L-alanyl-D-glutamate endopeptidase CwlK